MRRARWPLGLVLMLVVMVAIILRAVRAPASPVQPAAIHWVRSTASWHYLVPPPRPAGLPAADTPWLEGTLIADGHSNVFPLPPWPIPPVYLADMSIQVEVGGTWYAIQDASVPLGCQPQTVILDIQTHLLKVCGTPPRGAVLRVIYSPSTDFVGAYCSDPQLFPTASAESACMNRPIPPEAVLPASGS